MAKLFLTDYASYNEGTQFEFGTWVDLTEFEDQEDFLQHCKDHLKECDRKRPLSCGSEREEIMFTDYEGFPSDFYSESPDEELLQQVYLYLEKIDELPEEDDFERWIPISNAVKDYHSYEGYIYTNDEEFFEGVDAITAVQKAVNGDYNYNHDYVRFDGYANYESCASSDLNRWISPSEILTELIKNPEIFNLI